MSDGSVAYKGATASEEDISGALDEFFGALEGDDSLRTAVSDEGGDPDLVAAEGRQDVQVSKEGAGFGAETLILIAIGKHVGTRLWDKVIEPWLINRLGGSSLGSRQDS